MANDKQISLLFYKIDVSSLSTRLLNVISVILVILGIVGNVLGFCIFYSSRRFERISSNYVYLGTCNSIINLFCVIRYGAILHSTTRQFVRQLIGQTQWACKIYELSFSFRLLSCWMIVFWMFERLIHISKGLGGFINRWHRFRFTLVIPIIILIVIFSCVIIPPVYMYKPYSRKDGLDCNIESNTSVWWKMYFNRNGLGINHFTMRCLLSEMIPTGAIIAFNSWVIHHIVQNNRCSHEINSNRRPRGKHTRITAWMNIIVTFHSSFFLISLLANIVGHFMSDPAQEAWWVLLSILICSSLNFYVYFLSGRAFVDEIRRFFQCCQ